MKQMVCVRPEHTNCKNKNKVTKTNVIATTSFKTGASSSPTVEVLIKEASMNTDRDKNHCPAHDSGEVVHLPHETNCSLFYKCDEGRKVLHQCPPGLDFNPILQVCDLPQFANCTSKPGNQVDEDRELGNDVVQISSDSD
ncbi:hypothetical protein M0802_002300, partial [Mischocyttarus mexicanus]